MLENGLFRTWTWRNEDVFYNLRQLETIHIVADLVAIERVRSTRQIAGNELFDTCEFSGELFARCEAHYDTEWITRQQVKRELLGKITGNDAEIKRALCMVFGIEKPRGMMHNDEWQALAVAVVAERRMEK